MSLREKKAAKKKIDIIRSAAAVLAEKGYHGTTMEEVASNLLMTKGAMYYYFKNKEDLLYNCHQMIMEMSLEKITEIAASPLKPTDKLRKAIRSHFLLATSEKSMFMMMEKPAQNFTGDNRKKALEQRKEYEHYFNKILTEGIEKQEFGSIDVKTVRLIILGALNGTLQWYSKEGPQTADELADLFTDHLLKIVTKVS